MTKATNDDELANILNGLYDTPLPAEETRDAAQNLVGLFEVLLEIHNEGNAGHAGN